MKKIIAVFITFSGIYTGFAQNTSTGTDSIIPKKNESTEEQSIHNDTVIAKGTASVRVFPNPAKNKVEIEIRGFEPGQVQVQLLDNSGKKVREDKRTVFSGNETIVFMFSEKPGLYFLILKQNAIMLKSRLIIQ